MENFESDSKEIYQSLKQEWYNVLMQLWSAFGKPLDEDQFVIYAGKLSDVPLGILEEVIDRTIIAHKFNNVPTLAEVLQTLNDLHPNYAVLAPAEIPTYSHPNADAQRLERMMQGASQ